MKGTLALCFCATLLSGCAAFHKMDAANQAAKAGLIDGLSGSNHLAFTTWSWPSKPLGPYSKVAGFEAVTFGGTNAPQRYTFYLGKSRERRVWEVFAAMAWDGDKWKPVAVKLPEGRP
jgi:hypothetical protein